jgi:hypothetical protein
MAEEVGDFREGEVQYFKVLLDKAQPGHDIVEAEFELKAASAGENKDNEYFEIKTRKAGAHLMVVKAEGKLMLATELQQ